MIHWRWNPDPPQPPQLGYQPAQPYYQPPQQPSILPWPSDVYQAMSPQGQQERFGLIVNAVQQRTEAPLSLCIQAALGMGSFLLQNLVEIDVLEEHTTPVILHLIGIADPAEGKSSIMRYFQSPIDDYLKAAKKQIELRQEKYEIDIEIWKKGKGIYTTKIAKAESQKNHDSEDPDFKSLQADLDEHVKKKPTRPKFLGMAILSKATPASIPKEIKENSIESLAIVSAEAEEFFKAGIVHQSHILNKGWSLERTEKKTATRGDESHCTPITLILVGQPKIMHDTFSGVDNKLRKSGAVARGLFTCPPSTIGYRREPPSEQVNAGTDTQHRDDAWIIDDYHSWVTNLLDQNHDRHLNDTPKRRLRLSPDAKHYWEQYRVEVDRQLRPGGRYADYKDHGNRLAEQCLRVAAVLHGYNVGLEGDISPSTLVHAIHLVNAFSTEFEKIFREIPQEEKDAQKLLKKIQEMRNEGTRYVTKSVVKTRANITPVAQFNLAFDTLIQKGELKLHAEDVTNEKDRRVKRDMVDLFPWYPEDPWLRCVLAQEAKS